MGEGGVAVVAEAAGEGARGGGGVLPEGERNGGGGGRRVVAEGKGEGGGGAAREGEDEGTEVGCDGGDVAQALEEAGVTAEIGEEDGREGGGGGNDGAAGEDVEVWEKVVPAGKRWAMGAESKPGGRRMWVLWPARTQRRMLRRRWE